MSLDYFEYTQLRKSIIKAVDKALEKYHPDKISKDKKIADRHIELFRGEDVKLILPAGLKVKEGKEIKDKSIVHLDSLRKSRCNITTKEGKKWLVPILWLHPIE